MNILMILGTRYPINLQSFLKINVLYYVDKISGSNVYAVTFKSPIS